VKAARLIPIALSVLLACTPREVPYVDEIAAWRAEKDAFMQGSSQSPVPADKRASFPSLSYFPIDESYRVPAELSRVQSDEIIEMDTSDGQKRRMRRIGRLGFTVKGQALTLTAFADASENDVARLFVPFGDLTSGTETYPGGRYLDLDRTATGLYDLDFNRAYHPFCVFNTEYVCPIPPKENRLRIPIRAGEKL
jgi:uncharacterized protein (DUF1684 family)